MDFVSYEWVFYIILWMFGLWFVFLLHLRMDRSSFDHHFNTHDRQTVQVFLMIIKLIFFSCHDPDHMKIVTIDFYIQLLRYNMQQFLKHLKIIIM